MDKGINTWLSESILLLLEFRQTHEQESLGSNGFKVTHFTIRPYKNAKLTQQEQKCGTRISSARNRALGRVLIQFTI